jgi:hypothetical protein
MATVSIPSPKASSYYGVTVKDMRVFLEPAVQSAGNQVTVSISKHIEDSFFDKSGTFQRFVNTKGGTCKNGGDLIFTYTQRDSKACVPVSMTANVAPCAWNTIPRSPYGLWDITLANDPNYETRVALESITGFRIEMEIETSLLAESTTNKFLPLFGNDQSCAEGTRTYCGIDCVSNMDAAVPCKPAASSTGGMCKAEAPQTSTSAFCTVSASDIAPDLQTPSSSHVAAIVGGVVGCVVLGAAAIGAVVYHRGQRRGDKGSASVVETGNVEMNVLEC